MIIKCPECKKAYEYDDVFHEDDIITRGSQTDWKCDRCNKEFTLQIKFFPK
jgi:transposase-like protein